VIRVGLVDDHTLVRQGLRSLLAMVDGVEVAMEASDGEEALAALAAQPVDVLLLDLRMPRAGGLDVLRALRTAGSAAPAVVVLTTFQDDAELWDALRLGARGYLLKDVSLERLVGAIQAVHAGGTFIQPALTEKVARDLAAPDPGDPAESLTTRETEVLRLMAAGFSNREIADALGMAEGTVKNHVSSILGKLGVKDRTRAVLTAIENGLV
jgi:DNA-binding NarL/FixJ family response regulator